MRIEPYRQEEEDGDEEAKEACAYGSDARNNPCWYDYEEWKQHFCNWEEPDKEECTFMNGELFTNKVIKGRFGRTRGQRYEENHENNQEEEDEEYEDFGYQGNNIEMEEVYIPQRRGRRYRGGYGRGQPRGYEEEEYGYRPRGRGYSRNEGYRGEERAEEDQGWYSTSRNRGYRPRGRGGRRGARGQRGG